MAMLIDPKTFRLELDKLDCINKSGYMILHPAQLNTALKRSAVDAVPVVRGAPLIEINEPWQPMRGDKDRFYYTKRYLCRNCEYQIKTESWEKDRCFGAGTIFKENSMPNFCPNCGADLRT